MEESDIDYDQKTLVILGEEFDLQCIANESLSLEALYELASDRRDISGRRVWEGGLLLTKYLLEYGRALLNGKTVLELGAGTGVASIGAIRAGSEVVVASDGDKLCVPLLKDVSLVVVCLFLFCLRLVLNTATAADAASLLRN